MIVILTNVLNYLGMEGLFASLSFLLLLLSLEGQMIYFYYDHI